MDALTVPDATIVLNRLARADLAMLAQTPSRFRASVSKSGNELVSLAFSENGYSLRYKLDELPNGYYEGPPSECAVEAMLGVPFTYDGLVALVLGGAPILQEPYEILDQGWNSKGGYEALLLANQHFEQELRFARLGDRWYFAGSEMWQRAEAQRGTRLWLLSHEDQRAVGSSILPSRTIVRAPGRRQDIVIVIHYETYDLDPPWARPTEAPNELPTVSPDSSEHEQTQEPQPNASPAEDDPWGAEDDEPWETTGPTPAPQASKNLPSNDLPAVRMESSVAPTEPSGTSIPDVFELDSAGLTPRGDLCRRD